MLCPNQFLSLRKCYNINHSETSIQVIITKISTLYTVITTTPNELKEN